MKTIKQIIAALKKEQDKIAGSRDRLRELASEVEDQLESCDRANDDLGRAIDTLSEYV